MVVRYLLRIPARSRARGRSPPDLELNLVVRYLLRIPARSRARAPEKQMTQTGRITIFSRVAHEVHQWLMELTNSPTAKMTIWAVAPGAGNNRSHEMDPICVLWWKVKPRDRLEFVKTPMEALK